MNTKRTALALARQDGRSAGKSSKSRTSIVHEIGQFVQRSARRLLRLARQTLIAAGAGGLGLAAGSAMPPMLGLTGWRPGLTLAGLGLLAIGCAAEVMGE